MSKVKKDDGPVGWTYSGDEVDWDGFDRRMTRYMRKKLDTFGERLWMGEITGVESMSKNKSCSEGLSSIEDHGTKGSKSVIGEKV